VESWSILARSPEKSAYHRSMLRLSLIRIATLALGVGFLGAGSLLACGSDSIPAGDDDDDGEASDDDDDDSEISDDDDDDSEASDDDDDDDAAPSYARDIQPIFDHACGCHMTSNPAAGLALGQDDGYEALVDVENQDGLVFVSPGDVDASYLVNKVEDTQDEVDEGKGKMMPPSGDGLSDDEKETIRLWIEAGAKP
jgi:hypothetical protein